MPIDYDDMMQSGATGLAASYDEKDVMLYALGVGFGRDPLEPVAVLFESVLVLEQDVESMNRDQVVDRKAPHFMTLVMQQREEGVDAPREEHARPPAGKGYRGGDEKITNDGTQPKQPWNPAPAASCKSP